MIPDCLQTVTTNTAFNFKDNKLDSKLTVKAPHQSGFTLEKLEFAPNLDLTIETSLIAKAVEGLKLEYKGNNSNKGDLSFTYNVPSTATVTAEVDALNFSKANGSLTCGQGPVVAGTSFIFDLAKSSLDNYAFGVGYTVPKSLFTGLRVDKNISEFNGIFSYILSPELTVAGKVSHSNGKSGTSGVLAAIYAHNKFTTFKFKAASSGVINASVKKAFENKFTVVGSAEIPSGFTSGFKFGINATLG